MKLKRSYLLLLIIPLLSFSAHKYYLSLTQIEFVKDKKSVQVIINVFMDDIELALNKKNNIDLQLTTKKELKDNDIYFQNYLEDHLLIKINGTQRKINYLGKEYEGDLVYFYLEITDIKVFNSIEIFNNILIGNFPKQQNLIKIKAEKKYKSVLLTKKNDKALLKF